MPNDKHLPLCPYYKRHMSRSITCEDVCRTFSDSDKKELWLRTYCDTPAWEKCEYAQSLTKAYERLFKGDDKAIMEHEYESLKREIKKLSTLLGKSEKRVERQQKKIDELRAVNQSFTKVNQNLEKQKADFYTKWRSAESKARAQDDVIWNEIRGLASIYEQRMAYLIDTYCPNKKLRERDVEDWAKDRAYAIVATKIEDEEAGIEGEPAWKVVFQEEEEENKDDAETVSGDNRTEA